MMGRGELDRIEAASASHSRLWRSFL